MMRFTVHSLCLPVLQTTIRNYSNQAIKQKLPWILDQASIPGLLIDYPKHAFLAPAETIG